MNKKIVTLLVSIAAIYLVIMLIVFALNKQQKKFNPAQTLERPEVNKTEQALSTETKADTFEANEPEIETESEPLAEGPLLN